MPAKNEPGKRTGKGGRPAQPETSTGGRVTLTGLLALIKKQQYRCALTGVKVDHVTATVDHIVPLKYGGANTICNVQVVHDVVNRMKGTLSQAEFIAWCGKVSDANKT